MQTILNIYGHKMMMQEAANAPTFHHQLLQDDVKFEPNLFDINILENLNKKGYIINEKDNPIIGKVDAILVLP